MWSARRPRASPAPRSIPATAIPISPSSATVATGDEIEVTRRDGGHFRFRVTGTSVVRWDASGIDPLADGRRLALVTCWPLDGKFSGPLRYVVHAELVEGPSL